MREVTIRLTDRDLARLERLSKAAAFVQTPASMPVDVTWAFAYGLNALESIFGLKSIDDDFPSPLLPAGSSSNTSSLPPAGAPASFGEQQAGDTSGHGAAVKDEQTATGPGPVGSKDVLDGAECPECGGSGLGRLTYPKDCEYCGGTGVDLKRQKPTHAPRLVLKSCPMCAVVKYTFEHCNSFLAHFYKCVICNPVSIE